MIGTSQSPSPIFIMGIKVAPVEKEKRGGETTGTFSPQEY